MAWNLLYIVLSAFITVCLHPILGQKALADAGIPYSAVEQACVGYVYGKTFLLLPLKFAFILLQPHTMKSINKHFLK